ncbi:hypothetical protein [Lunatimonas salinarum]|uniref:hypothetical protein n=1 Tax=Lunatimonas salinarum TaxID=1774590 RepID=UPI001ADF2FD0|nr:hypothetical protein [Lunatimonas salinarum]
MNHLKRLFLSLITTSGAWHIFILAMLIGLPVSEGSLFSVDAFSNQGYVLISAHESEDQFPSDLPVGKENESQQEGESEVEDTESLDYFLSSGQLRLKLLNQEFQARSNAINRKVLSIFKPKLYVLFHTWRSELS